MAVTDKIIQVSPFKVHGIEQSPQGLAKLVIQLKHEGQIEPIRVKIKEQRGTRVIYELDKDHSDYWVYSDALVMAAQVLRWDTILVSVKVTDLDQWIVDHCYTPDDMVFGDRGLTDEQLPAMRDLLDIARPGWKELIK